MNDIFGNNLSDEEIEYINNSGKTLQQLRNEMKRKKAEDRCSGSY